MGAKRDTAIKGFRFKFRPHPSPETSCDGTH